MSYVLLYILGYDQSLLGERWWEVWSSSESSDEETALKIKHIGRSPIKYAISWVL